MRTLSVHVGFMLSESGLMSPVTPVIVGYNFVYAPSDMNPGGYAMVDGGMKFHIPLDNPKWWIVYPKDGLEAGFAPVAPAAKLSLYRRLYQKGSYLEPKISQGTSGTAVPLLVEGKYTDVTECDCTRIRVDPSGVAMEWTAAFLYKLFICSSLGYLFTEDPQLEDAGLFQIVDEEVIY